MTNEPLKWGILSAAKICNDFLAAMTTLPDGENIPVAIAARSKKSAQEMADKFLIPTAYEGYDALLDDVNVQIVYIGTLNNFHFEWIKKFLNAGKHVFCEKPLCLNTDQTEEVFALARSKKLFLAEAMWSRYNPSIKKMREIIRSGTLGDVVDAQANLGYDIINVPRIKSKQHGGGALLDLGVYSVMGILTAFDDMEPNKIHVMGSADDETGVDEKANITMVFSNGRFGVAKTSVLAELDNTMTVTLQKGRIVLPDFWSGYKVEIHRNDTPGEIEKTEFPPPKAAHPFNFNNSANMRNEIRCVRKAVQEGLTESTEWDSRMSILTAKILTRARHEFNYKFDFEK
ncbi:unnamed protein product [Oikopleura dioica]|uniref:Trans-1,2-dihydrobenzene-1,2-diol dehydrogenase n=2 Tax=Oikopleura dioica TaxID=34765 RepID=E4YEY6_OIKDI|nr:unnamed protein product [Oikopleura dioica]